MKSHEEIEEIDVYHFDNGILSLESELDDLSIEVWKSTVSEPIWYWF